MTMYSWTPIYTHVETENSPSCRLRVKETVANFSYYFSGEKHFIYEKANGVLMQTDSTVREKMAAVHFTTIPCEPN